MPPSFLEGYEEVDAFDDDLNDEYSDEEVFYVTLDMGQLGSSLLNQTNFYRLIGLETEEPFLQVGGTTFKGEHERLLGTEVLLQEPPSTSANTPSRPLVPVAMTSQRIRFKEVRLVPREDAEDEPEAGRHSPEREKSVPRTTLGGVSREVTSAFFPATRKDAAQLPKMRRRFFKRPEGYRTSEDEDSGVKPRKKKKSTGAEGGRGRKPKDKPVADDEEQEVTADAQDEAMQE